MLEPATCTVSALGMIEADVTVSCYTLPACQTLAFITATTLLVAALATVVVVTPRAGLSVGFCTTRA